MASAQYHFQIETNFLLYLGQELSYFRPGHLQGQENVLRVAKLPDQIRIPLESVGIHQLCGGTVGIFR